MVAPQRGALRRRRHARHSRHRGPRHLPVPLHVLEHYREPLPGRRGGLLVPHAELGHGRPLTILYVVTRAQEHPRHATPSTTTITTRRNKLLADDRWKTHRGVALRRGGPRPGTRRRVVVLPVRVRDSVAVAMAAVRGRGLLLLVSTAVVMGLLLLLVSTAVVIAAMVIGLLLRRRLRARALVVQLRRRRELALVCGAQAAARVGRRAAAALRSPVALPVVPTRRRLAVAVASRGRRPRRRRRRRNSHHGPLLGVVGVVWPVQRRRRGALVLAHLVEVDRVPDIVLVPGAELGHRGSFLQVRPRMDNPSFDVTTIQ